MQWQEIVLAVGQAIFIFALIPSISGKDKPALVTSLITSSVLMIFSLTYITMKLYFAAIPMFLTGVMWFILAYQKYKMNKKKRK